MRYLIGAYLLIVGTLLTIDSGDYFAAAKDSVILGYAFAAAMESSILILAFFSQKKERAVQALIAGLYVISVLSAGMSVAAPALATLASADHARVLRAQLGATQDNINLFDRQKQRGNTAKSAARAQGLGDELLELSRENTKSVFWIWLDIGIIFVSRLLLQLAALWLANKAGAGSTSAAGSGQRGTFFSFSPRGSNPAATNTVRTKKREPTAPVDTSTVDRYGETPALFEKKGQFRMPNGKMGPKGSFTPIKHTLTEDRRQYFAIKTDGETSIRLLLRKVKGQLERCEENTWSPVPELIPALRSGAIKLYEF